MTTVDCHQHVWPAALVEELRRRRRPPFLDGDVLHLDGEPPYAVDASLLDPSGATAEGDDLVLLAPSSPLGIESLPPSEAAALLEAWHTLLDLVEDRHRVWVTTGLLDPDLEVLAARLAHPAACGLQVPATALADPHALERLAPVLAVAEQADRAVLVHPGPAPATDVTHVTLPGWWPALTSYPAQQAAAWFAWHEAGRALLPGLRVGFVALAGLAPLHHERLDQRGGRFGVVDRGVFYETSSYGPRAIDAMTRVVGVDPLVHGSDRPYAASADPGLGDAFARAYRSTNPHLYLNGGSR